MLSQYIPNTPFSPNLQAEPCPRASFCYKRGAKIALGTRFLQALVDRLVIAYFTRM